MTASRLCKLFVQLTRWWYASQAEKNTWSPVAGHRTAAVIHICNEGLPRLVFCGRNDMDGSRPACVARLGGAVTISTFVGTLELWVFFTSPICIQIDLAS